MKFSDWIAVIIEYLTHLDGSLRKWHYSTKCIIELAKQKLMNKCASGLISFNGTATNTDTMNPCAYSATSNKAHKHQQNCISYDIKVDNTNSPKLGTNEESASHNVYTEYFTQKLKNLIESRIQFLDEQRQRKFMKKLKKIMRRSEKSEALQELVEKMIFKLEDEQKMKMTKKYQKIVRRFQKMLGENSMKSDAHNDLNEAEALSKNFIGEGKMASNGSAEMSGKPTQMGSGIYCNASLELQCRNEARSEGNSKRQKRKRMKSELSEPLQELQCDTMDIAPSPKRRQDQVCNKRKLGYHS